MSAPNPADYPHREVFLSLDLDAPFYTVILDAGAEPDALQLDLMKDAIVEQSHVLFIAKDRAALALFGAAFRRLAEQAAPTRH